MIKELLALRHRERVRVHVEITVAVHIVNIGPDVLEWNVVVAEIVHNFLKNGPVLVTPSALVVTEGEVLLHRWQSNSSDLVLLGDFWLRWSIKEEQIDATTECAPCNVFSSQQNLLGMGIAQEDTVRHGLVC